MNIKINKGFTLIEMIIAIAILSIMATITIAALDPIAQFQKANDARRKSDLAQIQRALETYYQDQTYQQYPAQNGPADYRIKDAKSGSVIDWGTSWQPYMNVVPKDPSSPHKHYVYYLVPTLPNGTVLNGQGYCLYASLDRIASADQCTSATGPCNTALCGGTCNFGVCSPNLSP